MRNKWLFIVLLLFTLAAAGFAESNPWGELKKIHFYDSVKNDGKVLENLEKINCDGMERVERDKIAARLIRFGDHYFSQKNYKNAEAFYRKVLSFSPEYWRLYNKLEKIDREQGGVFLGFKNLFNQFLMMIKNFESSFVLVNSVFNMLFFSAFFVFFLFALILFIKYFKLAGNDLLKREDGGLSLTKMLIIVAALLWPAVVLSGWMIYPFLLTGFLWGYLNDNERKSIFYLFIVLVVVSLFYSFNLVLERNALEPSFKTIQRVYGGHLYERQDYEKFDNELKVAQAYSYYENKQYDTARDILLSTPDEYRNKLKYDLTGSIYYKSDDFSECITQLSESLQLNDKDPVTLNNFTLALLRNSDEEVFSSYAKRYPEINELKAVVKTLAEKKINPITYLWKRLLSASSRHFEFGGFAGKLVGELLSLPVIYYMLLLLVYSFGVKRFTEALGGSTYCSKCTKIIKKASVHKSYKLCDECYQLFLIKDVIFLEAKILKEKELNKKYRKRYLIGLVFSLLIPGLNFTNKERNRLFLMTAVPFYFLLGFAVVGSLSFTGVFGTAPIFLNLAGMAAFAIYFLVNIISIVGDYDGI